MAKVLVVGDVHFSTYSSILRKRGTKFSMRLENLINSLNWVEEQAEVNNCDRVIYLGDFFDKQDLTAEELTALQEVVWAQIPHIFLVGNHEGLLNDLSTSSAHLFAMIPQATVIDKPTVEIGFGYEFLYLPYIMEKERKSIDSYYNDGIGMDFVTQEFKQRIVFSHNDVKMQYGMFNSVTGFDPNELNCSLFLNGHLHNGGVINDHAFNVGNLTGQNFSEDASRYEHRVAILTLENCDKYLEWIENPYAFNFYKFDDLSTLQRELTRLKNNSVITVKAPQSECVQLRSVLSNNPKIKDFRVISVAEKTISEKQEEVILESVSHLDKFVQYVKETMDNSNLLIEELNEVCK